MNALKKSKLFRSIICLGLSVLLVKIIGNRTGFSDHVFPRLQNQIGGLLYRMSGNVSFSLGDVFYLVLFMSVLAFVGYSVVFLFQRKYQQFQNTLASGIGGLTGIYLVFHVFWGFNYYKTPIQAHYDVELTSLDELKLLAEIYFLKSMAYRSQVNEDAQGVFQTSLTNDTLNVLLQQAALSIDQKYVEIPFYANVPVNLKKSLFSEGFSYLGIGGYYNPFTNEGQFMATQPDSKLLFTKMHETAHQWGFASESEANFIGFLLGNESDNVDLLYVSNFKAMRSLLNRILYFDPEFVKNYVENRYSEGMKRDRLHEIEVMEKYSGQSEDAFALMNETFLKMNNQEGLASYGRLVELLVGFNRKYVN